MAKQGYNSRLDESLGMRRGKESGMSQSYKSRRDESRGMAKSMNEKYMSKGMSKKVMGHDKMPKSIPIIEGNGWKQVKPCREGNKGYSSEAFNYKY